MKALSLIASLALATSAWAEVETFSIDNTHSFANWELRHVVARTSGTFHDIKGRISLDTANLANSSVDATISLYSLNSSHLKRDIHLLAEEFLDARNYPEMKFVSTGMTPVSAEKGQMAGQLTLHGVTKPVVLDYQILGIGADPWGGVRSGFKATTRINRADFGISKYAVNGPVGNEVDITLLIEGIKLGADGQPYNAKKAAEDAARRAAEEKAKVISYPMPAIQQPPVVQPAAQPASQPVAQPAAQPATSQPAPAPAPEKKESLEDQLKKKLKGYLTK